jgi:hypothetical protein
MRSTSLTRWVIVDLQTFASVAPSAVHCALIRVLREELRPGAFASGTREIGGYIGRLSRLRIELHQGNCQWEPSGNVVR